MADMGVVSRRAWKWLWWILGISLTLWIILGWAPRKAKEIGKEVQQSGAILRAQQDQIVKELRFDYLADLSKTKVPPDGATYSVVITKGQVVGVQLPACNFDLFPDGEVEYKVAGMKPMLDRPGRAGARLANFNRGNLRKGVFTVEAIYRDVNFTISLYRTEAVKREPKRIVPARIS